LRALAAKVLPQVDFIALREEVLGRPILRELGVPLDRVMTTGDDAIETAYNLRGDRLNWGLGLNARSSDYSDVDSSLLVSLRPDIRNAVVRHGTSIIPVPISTREDETDIDAIRTMAGNENIPAPFDRSNASPELVISQIKQCRLVVTGSYHAGVFAAALGVPVIGLAKSAYYMAKFRGLEAQFGSGCRTLALNRPEDVGTLSPTIDLLWENADALREELLSRAADQVLSIGRAYDRVGSDVEARRGPFQSERM
jgi:hypothetical protein